jgi:BMFP domain-containing protein YqiC
MGATILPLSLSRPFSVAEHLADLERRVSELEARQSETASRTSETLKQCNAKRRGDAQRLRQAISSVLANLPGPARPTAKHVLRAFEQAGITPLPSERTVRWHMAAIRGNGNTAVLPSQ